MGENVVSKRRGEKFEGVGVTNFGFTEEMLNFSRPWTNWEKRLGHQGTQCWKCGALSLHYQKGRVFFASLRSRRLCPQCIDNPEIKREIFAWVRERKTWKSCGNEDGHIVHLTIWHQPFLKIEDEAKKLRVQLSHGQPPAMNLKALILDGMKIQKSANHCGWQGWNKEPVARSNI